MYFGKNHFNNISAKSEKMKLKSGQLELRFSVDPQNANECHKFLHQQSLRPSPRLKDDNRREVAEVATRFYKGRSKVADQNQSPPVL